MQNQILDFLDKCPVINDDTNYWFIRTHAGQFLGHFKEQKIVGINYSEIKLSEMQKDLTDEREQEVLLEKIKIKYPKSKRPGLILSQLLRFKNEMKIGDYVVAPSINTTNLVIGKIVADEIEQTAIRVKHHKGSEHIKLFTKKVKWIKTVPRGICNPKLYQSFNSHQTIVDISQVSEWVDILLYDYYKKGNDYHYVINVEKEGSLKSYELHRTFLDLLDILNDLCNNHNMPLDVNEIETKINLNSPGHVKLICATVSLGVLGLILTAAVGGHFEVPLPTGGSLKFGTEGTLGEQVKIIFEAYDNHKDREVLRQKFRDLKVKTPETFTRMVRQNSSLFGLEEK